ncbi:MAG: OmpA family protein [Pseudomonadota bacterium]
MRLLILVLLVVLPLRLAAQDIIDPFAGSVQSSSFFSEFDQVTILVDDGEGYRTRSVEGEVRASIHTAPEGKSQLEIARSFEIALTAAGFDLLFSRPVERNQASGVAARDWVRDLEGVNARDFLAEDGTPERRNAVARLYTFPSRYLSASRTQGGTEIVFAVTFSDQRNLYMMEQVTRTAMEEGTVTLSESAVTGGIEAEGKAILYGVQFDVGSAVLRPTSEDAIEVIANVLRERPGNYYVVGHTSDTGAFELNMRLSAERAAAIIEVLGAQYGIDTSRLQAAGVGPVAPLASNQNEAGRQLNRRVELVERLE